MASRRFEYSQPVLKPDGKTIVWETKSGYIPAATEKQFYERLPQFLGQEAVKIGEHDFACRSIHLETVRVPNFEVPA